MAAKRVKRPFNFPVGDSPGKPKNKIPACPQPSSRKSLFSQEESTGLSKKPIPWSDNEPLLSNIYVYIGKMLGLTSGHQPKTLNSGKDVQML